MPHFVLAGYRIRISKETIFSHCNFYIVMHCIEWRFSFFLIIDGCVSNNHCISRIFLSGENMLLFLQKRGGGAYSMNRQSRRKRVNSFYSRYSREKYKTLIN